MATLPPPRIRFALITAPEGEDWETETVRLSRTQRPNRGGLWTAFTSFSFAQSERLDFYRNFAAVSPPVPVTGEKSVRLPPSGIVTRHRD
ncbi:hypothetical protein C0J45_21069 [Silurus meridionalis]|nr:hypothetical protein C0J45_21069 [Silurus meridionalis]